MSRELFKTILSEEYSTSRVIFEACIREKCLQKIAQLREAIQNVRRVGRLKLVRLRIRRGKVQRRKKVSAIKGWTFRQGKMKRMMPRERMRRRLSQRRAKIKRRAKLAVSRRKTKIALRKRKALGLRR